MTSQEVWSSVREWIRRVSGALSRRRADHDLQRELAGHLALAEDELRRKGHAPSEAARLARAAAGGRIQALPGAAAFMLLVGALAALGPARRGLRIDPTEALRSE